MLELISLVGGLILCFYIPYEAGKVRTGWIRKNFKGEPTDFRAAYLKQLTYLMWVGSVIAVVDVALAPLSDRSGEWVFKLIGAVVWLAVAGLSYNERRRMMQTPA